MTDNDDQCMGRRWTVVTNAFIAFSIFYIQVSFLYKWAAKLREMIVKWCVDKSMFSHFYTTHKINIHTL